MPQNPKDKFHYYRHVSLTNKVDGKLTYREFMSDLEGKLTEIDVDRTLVAPGGEGPGKPTVAEAVNALKKKGWATTMPVDQITSGRTSDYNDLMGRADAKLQSYFDDPLLDPKWKRRLIEVNLRTHELSREIVALRQQEFDGYVLKLLTKGRDTEDATKIGGLGMRRDELVMEEVTSFDGKTRYERVDLGQTFMNHPDPDGLLARLPKAYKKDWQGVVNWLEDLGNDLANPKNTLGPEFTAPQKTHYVVKTTWSSIYRNARMRLGILSPSCST